MGTSERYRRHAEEEEEMVWRDLEQEMEGRREGREGGEKRGA